MPISMPLLYGRGGEGGERIGDKLQGRGESQGPCGGSRFVKKACLSKLMAMKYHGMAI